jgi:hypothetical protein
MLNNYMPCQLQINCNQRIIHAPKPKIPRTQFQKFGAEFNIQHQLPPFCYVPPGLPPKHPLQCPNAHLQFLQEWGFLYGEEVVFPTSVIFLTYNLPLKENTKSNCNKHFTTTKEKCYRKTK